MTQGELAEKLGVKFQQVQKYESGANRIAASRLWDSAQALQVPISYFFDGLPDPSLPNDAATPAAVELSEASMLIQYYSNMSEAERRHLRGLAQLSEIGEDALQQTPQADGEETARR